MRVNQQHSHLLSIPLFPSASKLLSFASVLPVPTSEQGFRRDKKENLSLQKKRKIKTLESCPALKNF